MHEAVLVPPTSSPPDGQAGLAVPPAAAVQAHRLQFDGQAGEYFRIWIVNVALTLLTLGVYSAWAKVRSERYFYGNTRLDGVPFEYLAQPLPILRGRILAAALFGLYLLTAQVAPIWNLAVLGLVLLLTPWIVRSGLRFRARYSAWRGLSFRFDGTQGQAYALYLGWMLPVLLTMGMLYPWLHWRQIGWIARQHRYGRERFALEVELGRFYAAYAIAFAAMIGSLVMFVLCIVGLSVGLAALEADEGDGRGPGALAMGLIYGAAALFYLGYFAIFIGLRAALANLVWNHASLGPHRFRSSLRIHQVVWIFLGNAVAIVASLGLLVPWAKVRLARYRAEHFEVLAAGPLDRFAADARQDEAAAGAEIGDAFDIDLSI